MALKKDFSDDERYGLSEEEYKLGRKYLRANKTRGALKDLEAAKLYELFLLGDSFQKLAQQFPEYPIGQIVLTAALRGWVKDREKMTTTLQDRVRAKVVKSVLDQVDFLTAMLSVSNAEHLSTMQKYVQDPINNPKPTMRVETIKEYKDVAETLYKIVAGATQVKQGGQSPMFSALTSQPKKELNEPSKQEESLSILDAQADDDS
jgi:hypothetical protein